MQEDSNPLLWEVQLLSSCTKHIVFVFNCGEIRASATIKVEAILVRSLGTWFRRPEQNVW